MGGGLWKRTVGGSIRERQKGRYVMLWVGRGIVCGCDCCGGSVVSYAGGGIWCRAG